MAKLLHQRIVSLREYAGLSQADLAERAGIESSYISKLERGLAPNAAGLIVAKLAAALETTTDYLLGLTDDPNPHPVANHPSLRDPCFRRIADLWPEMPQDAQDVILRVVEEYVKVLRVTPPA